MFWLLTLTLGCAGGDCASRPAGTERDLCLHDELLALPGAEVAQARTLAGQIQDPMVQGAAVFSWVIAHNREIDPRDGMALCALLAGQERQTCVRKLSQVHLRR